MSKSIKYSSNGRVSLIDSEESFELKDKMKPGFYRTVTEPGFMGKSMHLEYSNLIDLPNTHKAVRDYQVDMGYINKFFSKAAGDIYTSMNIKRKLGIILYGTQGTGKSTTILSIANELVNNNQAIVMIVNDHDEFMFAYRSIEIAKECFGDFLAVIIFDECEDAFKYKESLYKHILDGSKSMNNFLFLGTTNYIREIPNAIIKRPSRIKICTEVKGIDAEDVIFNILKGLNIEIKVEDSIIRNLVDDFKGETLDVIKNTFTDKILDIKLNNLDPVDVEIKELLKT